MAQSITPEYQLPGSAGKTIVLALMIAASAIVLSSRLFWLQILQHRYYQGRSLENSSRVTFMRAPRGIIYDRHGNLLAANKQSLSLTVIPGQLEEIDLLSARLAHILELPEYEMHERLEKARESNSVLPVVLEHDLDLSVVGKFFEQKLWLPGLDILPDISRSYPQADLTAHILGYCGEITEDQLKNRPHRRMGDVIGQDGVERIYDEQLRGMDGEQRVRVNAAGHSLSPETASPKVTKEAEAGQPIVLSIDLDLQRAAYQGLGNRHGAVVVADPQTGEILAMVSRPSYDPNVFSHRDRKAVLKLFTDPSHPLYNRALSGFPPGSIWKAITLLAALQNKVVKPDTKLHVSGGIALGGFFFHDWTSRTGLYDLVKCLAWSRDSAFYQMALHMTPEMIKEWAVKFGAGRPTGVELAHEGVGLVPDSRWKWKNLHEKWYPGNTLHMSIGQSFVELTPAQAARLYSGIGMRGQVPNLHFVIKIGDRQIPPPRPEHVSVKKEYLKVVLDGLKAVVASGTGGATRLGNVEVSGKTGSAEAPPAGSKTHAWFCCYAPSDKPRIAICAMVEHGGHGGSAAAPIARAILEKFFSIARPDSAPAQRGKIMPIQKRTKPH